MADMFQEVVEQAPDGVVILERGRIVFINATAAALLGTTPETGLGTPIADHLPPADAAAAGERIGRMLATGQPTGPNEYRTRADDNRVVEIKSVPWRWQGRPAVLGFARDVTERKALQQQLVHAGRLAAVGTLAAGVAHEINNPLQYMQLCLQEVVTALAAHPELAGDLKTALTSLDHGIERIATITRSLRTFARPHVARRGPVDLCAVVDHALNMVATDLRHRARLVREVAEVRWVTASTSELEQVVVNLLVNAIQALTGKPDDTITVAIHPRGEDVVLEVRDTGRGMTPEVRDRVFEPFFTTKPVGAGMGLGLSVSKGIIDALGGALELVSAPDAGTTARVVLRGHVSPAEPVAPAKKRGPVARRRVLVIDDEDRVRSALAGLLRAMHDVVEAGDGRAALAALAAGAFDAIVCNIMMPGMNGAEVYQQIARDHPGVEQRVVFVTGGAFVPELRDFVAATGNRVLEKPFVLDDILDAIETAAHMHSRSAM